MKYLFFDIDGTLLSHSNGIAESAVNALKKAQENGHKIFLNTGRSLAEISPAFDQFNFDGYVCAAGSYIKIGDQVILNKIISEKDVSYLIEIMDSIGLGYGLEGEEFTFFSDEVYLGYVSRMKEAFEKGSCQPNYKYEPIQFMIQPEFVKNAHEYSKNPIAINKLLLYAKDINHLKELENKLERDFHIINYGTFGELLNYGVNKGTGIVEVIKYYGASLEDTISFGDSLNDLEMLQISNVGVAMENASVEVKEISDMIAGHINKDGLANAMKDLNLI